MVKEARLRRVRRDYGEALNSPNQIRDLGRIGERG